MKTKIGFEQKIFKYYGFDTYLLLPNLDQDTYSVHFARFAAKLEKHLLNHGVACSEADVIIEDSSTIFFDKLNNPKKSFLKLFKKQDPMSLFIELAKIISPLSETVFNCSK